MNVRQLIERLQKADPEMPIVTDDPDGEFEGIHFVTKVFLVRSRPPESTNCRVQHFTLPEASCCAYDPQHEDSSDPKNLVALYIGSGRNLPSTTSFSSVRELDVCPICYGPLDFDGIEEEVLCENCGALWVWTTNGIVRKSTPS